MANRNYLSGDHINCDIIKNTVLDSVKIAAT